MSIAIEGKYVDLAKVLIDRGGNITVKEKNIMITLSKDNNTEQIVDFLKNRVIYTPLHYAAREGKKELIISSS